MAATVADLGRLVKQKYPGKYDRIADDELGRTVAKKYPQYQGRFADVPAAAPVAPTAAPEHANTAFGQPRFSDLPTAGKVGMRMLAGALEVLPSLGKDASARRAAVPPPTNTAERLQEGLGGAAAFMAEAVPVTLATAGMGAAPLVAQAAGAAIPAALQAGTPKQRIVRGAVMAAGGAAAGAVRPAAAAIGAGAKAQQALETVSGPAIFGGAAPWVETAAERALGEKRPWPTAREALEGMGLLAGVGAAAHVITNTGRGGRQGPSPVEAPERLPTPGPVVNPAVAAIKAHVEEPASGRGAPEPVKARSRVATEELNKQLVGKPISFKQGDLEVSGTVAYGRIFDYPQEPNKVRLLVADPQSGQIVPFSFPSLEGLRAAVAEAAEAKPESRAATPEAAGEAPAQPAAPVARKVVEPPSNIEDAAGRGRPGVLMPDGKFITGTDHGDAINRAEDMGYVVDRETLGQVAGWKIGGNVYLDKDFGPNGEAPQAATEQGAGTQQRVGDAARSLRPGPEDAEPAPVSVEAGAGAKEPDNEGAAVVKRLTPESTGTSPAEGRRGYKRGEYLTVPYEGRSKNLRSEKGRVEGYVEKGGEPHVVVRVSKGKTAETRVVPESMVKRVARRDRRAVTPERVKAAEKKSGGDLDTAVSNMHKLEGAYERAEARAKQLDHRSDEYAGARRRARALMEQAKAARHVAYDLGWKPEGPIAGHDGPQYDEFGGNIVGHWKNGEFTAAPGVGTAPLAEGSAGRLEGLPTNLSAMGVGEVHAAVSAALKRWAAKFTPTPSLEPERPAHVQRVLEIIKQAEPLRSKQEKVYTEERKRRIPIARKAGETAGGGEAGFRAEKSRLAGDLGRVPWGHRELMSQGDVDALFRTVAEHPDLQYFETVTGRNALGKLLGYGEVPTDSELALLERVFGADFVGEILKRRPLLVRLREFGYEAINVPRALMASFDLSAPFRQGLFLGAAYPKQFARALPDMLRQFASPKFYEASVQEIRERPNFKLMQRYGLALTEVSRRPSLREEQFLGGSLAEKIPGIGAGVRASNRAYTGFLNRLRADAFDSLINDARQMGHRLSDPKVGRSIADFVNTASGRGDGRFLRQHMTGLNAIFFSPRFIASRIRLLNPAYYVKLHPVARRAAIRGLVTLGGAALTMTGMAAAAGLQVETDPRSADFAKLKVGDTRYDILGGFQQYIRFAAQMALGPPQGTRLEALGRFVESKTTPVVSFGIGALRGSNMLGKPFVIGPHGELTKPETWTSGELLGRFTPMFLSDAWNTARASGPAGVAMAAPGLLGVGVQTYHGGRPQRPQRPSRRRNAKEVRW